MQTQSINPEKPGMLNSISMTPNPILALFQEVEKSDLERDFLEIVTSTAETAGCLFLFEVPGSLFGKPDYRAAAVVHAYDELHDHIVFILCNQADGTLEIYDEAEVPEYVTDFVGSYANVLIYLQELESRNQLH